MTADLYKAGFLSQRRNASVTPSGPATRWCQSCRRERPAEDFGRHPNCTECIGIARRLVARIDYDALLAAQGGVCAICGCEPPEDGTRFHLDHDHLRTTINRAAMRGLLCRLCNLMLGAARDEPDILQAAIAYLERGHTDVDIRRREVPTRG